jgi:uncharacterized LabA/DUF88 family protein
LLAGSGFQILRMFIVWGLEMHRVSVFIDGAYLDHVLEEKRQGKRVDYNALIHNIVGRTSTDREITRIYYYHCLPYQHNPPSEDESKRFSKAQRFFRALQRTPRFEVRLGRLAYRGEDSASYNPPAPSYPSR